MALVDETNYKSLPYMKDLFLNQQLAVKGTTWELLAPKVIKSERESGWEDKNGITHFENNGSMQRDSHSRINALKNMESILIGIMPKDTQFSVSGGHVFAPGMPQSNVLIDTFASIQKEAKNKYQIFRSGAYRFTNGDVTSAFMGNKAGLVAEAGKLIGEVTDTANSISKAAERFLGDQMNGIFGLGSDDILGGQFLTTYDFAKIYNGSSGSISIPAIRTRILFDGTISVADRIKKLNKYLMNGMKHSLGLYGMQTAPMGYMASYNELDQWDITKGSVSLRIGNSLYIHNLLVTSFDYTFSSQKVESKTGISGPLYADVEIRVETLGYISRGRMEQIFDQLSKNDTKMSYTLSSAAEYDVSQYSPEQIAQL